MYVYVYVCICVCPRQIIVATRGALGSIIGLLPNPAALAAQAAAAAAGPAPGTRGGDGSGPLHLLPSAPNSADFARASAGLSPSTTTPGATPPAAVGLGGRPNSAASGLTGGGVGGGVLPTDPYEGCAAAGVEAALALCAVAAHSREVARVLAGKTTLVATLLAVLRERRAGACALMWR